MVYVKNLILKVLRSSPKLQHLIQIFFPEFIIALNVDIIKDQFIIDYVQHLYSEESIIKRKFYNIGSGNQRSKFDFWSYIDLKGSGYNNKGIDIYYDLESLGSIPIDDNYAEVIFNSFVIEHISIEATKNLCREAYRILKKGGVFHSKVHDYDYGYKLLKKNLISPKVPFGVRESADLLKQFIQANGSIEAHFNKNGEYVIESRRKHGDTISFNPVEAFFYHNATVLADEVKRDETKQNAVRKKCQSLSANEFFDELKNSISEEMTRLPHQHNANYFPKQELFDFIKSIGFSEVYFTQPYQSVTPVLWEEKLNPLHFGFTYSIEAIK